MIEREKVREIKKDLERVRERERMKICIYIAREVEPEGK